MLKPFIVNIGTSIVVTGVSRLGQTVPVKILSCADPRQVSAADLLFRRQYKLEEVSPDEFFYIGRRFVHHKWGLVEVIDFSYNVVTLRLPNRTVRKYGGEALCRLLDRRGKRIGPYQGERKKSVFSIAKDAARKASNLRQDHDRRPARKSTITGIISIGRFKD